MSEAEAVANEDVGMMEDMAGAFADEENDKYYYLVGLTLKNGKREIDFVFDYTDGQIKAAMMEEIQYNSLDEDAKKTMNISLKQRFGQAFLLYLFRKKMLPDSLTCTLRSDKELNEAAIQEFINNVTEEQLLEKKFELPEKGGESNEE